MARVLLATATVVHWDDALAVTGLSPDPVLRHALDLTERWFTTTLSTIAATLLDWEGWELPPAATTSPCSTPTPDSPPKAVARIRCEFAPVLDSAIAQTALLVVCAELLQSAARGDHPELRLKL